MSKKLDIYSDGGEWSALYVDGKLEIVGDTYLAEERAMAICGVNHHDNSPDWIGPDGSRESVAQSIEEIKRRRVARLEREQAAASLEREANAMIAKAKLIRSGSESI